MLRLCRLTRRGGREVVVVVVSSCVHACAAAARESHYASLLREQQQPAVAIARAVGIIIDVLALNSCLRFARAGSSTS